ncbi:DUF4352 domain-containing protein [Streptomyces phyllanthi]|uniref:DUF4352 domain-containing protein n=1 Tax=Streptomyces phyllanthi TaxID=1803180 RepID=A0A5N8WI52_9ACTN|nr:DUF4352 domain-containing protein [Streptomyces phyllanthi]
MAAAGALTSCGSGGSEGREQRQAPSVHTASPQTPRPASAIAEAAVGTPSGDDVPVLEKGQTLPVAIPEDEILNIPASSADVTLTDYRQADVLPQGEFLSPETADPQNTFVCLEFRVKNTGSADFDTAPLTQARWTGKDGQTKQIDHELSGDCAELGFVKETLLNEPDPRPGEFVTGTTVFMVPDTQPGALEFSTDMEHATFKIEVSGPR